MLKRDIPMSIHCFCKDIAATGENESAKCFCNLWLFEHFSEEDYALLKSIGRQRVISKGQTVFSQGASADEIFLVKTGRVKLSKYTEDGSECILDFRKSGELFGEHVFIDECLFPLNAMAIEETVTCGANKADLERLVLKHPHIGLIMMKNMSRQIYALSSRLLDVNIGSMEDRIYQILVNIANRHGVASGKQCQIAFPLTHEELGFLANVHRVSVTKAVNKLIQSGRIVRKGKLYSFPDFRA